MTKSLWKSAPFFIATKDGPVSREGKIYKGIGYDLRQEEGLFLGEPSIWAITHLGTGYALCRIEGTEPEIAAIATEFAHAGNWDFDTLDGWKKVDPDLLGKVRAILKKHCDRVSRCGSEAMEEPVPQVAEAR